MHGEHSNIMATIEALHGLDVDPFGRDAATIRAAITGPVCDGGFEGGDHGAKTVDRSGGEDVTTGDQPLVAPGVSAEVKSAVDELGGLVKTRFEELREQAAKGDPEARANIERLFERMQAVEEAGAKAARAVRAKWAADEHVERKSELLERIGLAPATPEAKDAWSQALRFGTADMDREQKSLLLGLGKTDDLRALIVAHREGKSVMTVGNQATGGFLAPAELVAGIEKGIVDLDPIRELARVRQTSSNAVRITVRTALGSGAQWETETSTTTRGDGPRFGRIEIPVHKLRSWVTISTEDLEDPVYDMEAELREAASLDFALTEGEAFCIGDGDKKPEGMWFDDRVQSVASGSASAITEEQLRRIAYGIHEQYARQATWLMRRATLLDIALLKDGQNNYVYNPGITGTVVIPTILTRPVREVPHAPAVGAGASPILFGDIRRFYTIVDRVGVTVKRDEFSNGAAENDDVNFWTRKRTGGQVVDPNAAVKGRVATS